MGSGFAGRWGSSGSSGISPGSDGGAPGTGGRLAINRPVKWGSSRARSTASLATARRCRATWVGFRWALRWAGRDGSAREVRRDGWDRTCVSSFKATTPAGGWKLLGSACDGMKCKKLAHLPPGRGCTGDDPCYRPGTSNSVGAGVAELVDALVLGTSIARCGGSSPFARTSSSARTRRAMPLPGKSPAPSREHIGIISS
jgi:hypothetical protein